jgi:hypothetical protein
LNLLILVQHGGHGGSSDLAYFWASILIVLLPLGAFVALAYFAIRGYYRRKEADGGGAPPNAERLNAERGSRNAQQP